MKSVKLLTLFLIPSLVSCGSPESFRRELSKSAALQEVIQATTGKVVAAGIQWALDAQAKKNLDDGGYRPYPESGK